MMHNHHSAPRARFYRANAISWLKLSVPRALFMAGLGVLLALPIARHAEADPAKDVSVIVTIKPLHALASQVLDGIAVPKLLIDGAQSPHVFALKPSDAAALHKADLFFRTDPDLEQFSEKIRASLPKKVHVLSAVDMNGVAHLSLRQGGAFEAHDHGDHGDHKDHDHDKYDDHGEHAKHDDHDKHGDHKDHDHDKHDDHGEHAKHDDHDKHGDHKDHDHDKHDGHTDARDSHIWLDPKNAIAIVNGLVAELKEIAPQHAEKLAANGNAAIARLATLDKELTAKLGNAKGKPFIVFHDAFQYFETRYGLKGVGAITLHPEVPLSGKRLQEIRKTIKTSGAQCVFSEPQFSTKRVSTVAEGTGAKIGVLDPLGAKIQKGPGAYAAMMHALADGFDTCLGKK